MKQASVLKTIIIDDENHWRAIIKKLASTIPELSIVGEFSDVESAYDFLLDHEIDLIFLDVQIKDDNGIDLIKRLHKAHHVIIISSSSDFAFEGFSISAIDYLKKPIVFEKFQKAVQKVIQSIKMQSSLADVRKNLTFDKDYFLVKDEQGMIRIRYQDVLYISALENYVKIITTAKNYMILTTLTQFEKQITSHIHPFLRVHRSHLINLNRVKILNKEQCILSNDHEIPIGEMYRAEIHEIFVDGKIIKR
jgi:DNA-binding LytR/AlgR family response regulator